MPENIDGGTLITPDEEDSRQLDGTDPVTVVWESATPDSMLAEVSFDGTVYVPTVGSVTHLGGDNWQLSYHPQDRPTNPSTVIYRFTDNNSNQQLVTIPFVGTVTTPELPELTYSAYGPKRVKTKQMEIETHDPEKLQRLTERSMNKVPTFCSSAGCVGVPLEPHKQASQRNFRD